MRIAILLMPALFFVASLSALGEESPNLRIYSRFIFSKTNPFRTDETILVQRPALSWLDTEFGFRVGQSSRLLSYYQYKLEFTTARFLQYLNLSGQLSNEVNIPAISHQTNWMLTARGRYALSKNVLLTGSLGVFDAIHQKNQLVLPAFQGPDTVDILFRFRIRVRFQDANEAVLAWGNFDVFSPYSSATPFFQVDYSRDFETFSLFSYFRYRYSGDIGSPYAIYVAAGAAVPL